MKTNSLTCKEHFVTLSAMLTFLFLLSPMILKAQVPVNFSGKWEFDKAKSDPNLPDAKYEGTVTRQITQTPATIAYHDIYVQKGSNDWSTLDEVFNLDGKEQVNKDASGTNRKFIKWSQDGKTLTLSFSVTYTEEGAIKEMLIAESYKLSDDGKTLTIETYSKNEVTGESKTMSLYHKK